MRQSTIAKIEAAQRPVRVNEAVLLAAILHTDLAGLWLIRPGGTSGTTWPPRGRQSASCWGSSSRRRSSSRNTARRSQCGTCSQRG